MKLIKGKMHYKIDTFTCSVASKDKRNGGGYNMSDSNFFKDIMDALILKVFFEQIEDIHSAK